MKRKHMQIDTTGWRVDAFDEYGELLQNYLRKALNEVLTYAFEQPETNIYFPAEWGDGDGYVKKRVADPLTVYLRLWLAGEQELPVYEFNLRDALALSIEECELHGSYIEGLGRVATALRDLAAEIDAARDKHLD